MSNIRLIARLDIKGGNLIKSINFEGLRVLGDPEDYARRYYKHGIDELIYMDCVATLYGRNHLAKFVSSVAKDIFVPMTVGGGIRSLSDVDELLRAGADKVAVNTAAVTTPSLISDIATHFGSQCMVLSIEAKCIGNGSWEVFTHNGRERTGLDVIEWAKRGVEMGAGEILITSVDREGTRKGFETDLVYALASEVSVPLIASGGMGEPEHLIEIVSLGGADAVAMADILHYDRSTIGDIRSYAKQFGLSVRNYEID